jgi:hypothetical protein
LEAPSGCALNFKSKSAQNFKSQTPCATNNPHNRLHRNSSTVCAVHLNTRLPPWRPTLPSSPYNKMGRGGGGNGSFFEYNITRPFPFKHFTLIAVVLGILWLAIVTVINVLSQGYILVTTYSTDWTGLEAAGRSEWYASIISKTRSSCQPKLFEVGDSFRSNSSGLMYEVSGFRYAASCQANGVRLLMQPGISQGFLDWCIRMNFSKDAV